MTRGRPSKIQEFEQAIFNIQLNRVKSGKKEYKAPGMQRILIDKYTNILRKNKYSESEITRKVNEIKKKLPGKSSIQKYLKKIRPKILEYISQDDPLEKPWCIGSLAEHSVPPETLPIIMRVYLAERTVRGRTEELLRVGYELGHETYLTVRVALWLARLAPLFKYPDIPHLSPKDEREIDENKKAYKEFDRVTCELVSHAQFYAESEKAAKILDINISDIATHRQDVGRYEHNKDIMKPVLVSFPELYQNWGDTIDRARSKKKKGGQL